MLVVELAELLKELLVKCNRCSDSAEIEQVARQDSLKVINRKRYESDYHNRALSTVSSGDAREPDTKQSSAIQTSNSENCESNRIAVASCCNRV